MVKNRKFMHFRVAIMLSVMMVSIMLREMIQQSRLKNYKLWYQSMNSQCKKALKTQ